MGEASGTGAGARARGHFRRHARAVRRLPAARRAAGACACLLLLMGANLPSAAERKSISDDKFVHITAGYYHLVDGDFYMSQLASARTHRWYLSDSNVERGDDVKALAECLKARGETSVCGAVIGNSIYLYRAE